MRPNVLLVKIGTQYLEVDGSGAGERREALLELGGETDADAARGIGERVLASLGEPPSSTVIRPAPGTIAPQGFVDYGLGAACATPAGGGRVVAIAFSTDDVGRITTVPQLDDPVAVRERQTERLLARLADGGVGGLSEAATRVVPKPPIGARPRVYEGAYFTHDGPLVAGVASPPWNPPFPMLLTQVIVSLGDPGGGPTVLVMLNGTGGGGDLLATATIGAGKALVALDYPIESAIRVDPTMQVVWVAFSVGSDAGRLLIQPRFTTA